LPWLATFLVVDLSAWDGTRAPQLIADDDAWKLSQDAYIWDSFATWKPQAQLVALGSLCWILEDATGFIGVEGEEDHDDGLVDRLSPQARSIGRAEGPDTDSGTDSQ
jgi:hypothetical protein